MTLVSLEPADTETGWNPSAPMRWVVDNTQPFPFNGLVRVELADATNTEIVTDSVPIAGWEFTATLSMSDERITCELIPTGGWLPSTFYGESADPRTIFRAIAWTTGGGGFYEIAPENEPEFTTGLALTATEITGTELEQYEIDAPIISWRSETRHAEIALWNASGDGAFDNGDPYYPEARAYDEIGDLPSRSGTHDTTIYYVLDLGEEREIDCCLLLGNFDRLTTCTQVRLAIGSSIEFTSPLTIVEWDDPGRRCASWTLGAGMDPAISVAGRYSARFVRVEIDYAGSGEYPEIWELFLARRWSPPGDPLLPVSIDGAASSVIIWDSASGHSRSLPAVRERRAASLVWPLIGSTAQEDAQDWGDSIEAGAYPCLMCLRPFSGPEETMLVRVAADVFSAPWTGPLDQRITVDFEEQAPFIARDP